MKTMDKNYAEFLARIANKPNYEQKSDRPLTPMEEITDSMRGIADIFEKNKVKQDERFAQLTKQVDQIEIRANRPGAGATYPVAASPDDRLRLIDQKTGKPVLVLKAGDDINAQYARHRTANPDGNQFDLEERDSDATMSEFFRGVAGMRTRSELVRKALNAGTDTAGGFTLPIVVFREVLGALAPASTVLTAGGLMIPLDPGDGAKSFSYAAVNALPTAAWRNESGALAESDPTFRQVSITPRSLAFYFKVSRELLADSINIDATLRQVVAQSFARELDRAALLGTGAAPQPRGLANIVGIQTVTNGTNGASLATTRYANIFAAQQSVLGADAPMADAAIMSHRSLIGLGQLTDTTNQPMEVPPMLRNMKLLSTSQISNALTVGTSTDCTQMFVGNFKWAGFALRENVNVEVMREAFVATGEIAFVCHARVDVVCLYPAAFALVTGVRP